MEEIDTATNKTNGSKVSWLKRLGFAGFMFFFIKGLIWLLILMIPAYLAC